jgi:protein SMG7
VDAVELEHETVRKFDAVTTNLGALQAGVQLCSEGEDDEEIVFKPTASEKFPKVLTEQPVNGYIPPVQMSTAGWPTIGGPTAIQSTASVSAPGNGYVNGQLPMSSAGWAPNGGQAVIPGNIPMSAPYEFVQPIGIPTSSWVSSGAPLGTLNTIPTFSSVVPVSASMVPQMNGPDYLKSLFEQEKLLMMGLNNVNLAGNGFLEQRFHGGLSELQSMGYSPHLSVESGRNNTGLLHNQVKANEEIIPSTSDTIVPSVAASGGVTMKLTDAPEAVSKKNPVSRPSRPVGPPPGFNHVTPKRHDDFMSFEKQHQQIDDYSWLDGYQPSMDNVHNARAIYPDVPTTSSAFTTPFPFPGKQQVSGVHARSANEKTWQDFHLFDPAKQNMVQNHQQINQQSGQVAEKQPAKPIGSGRYLV